MTRPRALAGILSILLTSALGAGCGGAQDKAVEDAADRARDAATELKQTIGLRLSRSPDHRSAYDGLLAGLPRYTPQRGGLLLRSDLAADQAWFDITVVKTATASGGFSHETRTVRLCAHITVRFPAGQRPASSMTDLNCPGDLAKTDPQLGTIDKVVRLGS
ncbi:hypothetical protein [Actinomadura litoris]|uniref:Lipoprotein n=1 Tax=Actinomadura litoris TaxID=2678616 RepID=A0A7K1L2C6_9ACTN|nr:hypothetical protein [Actinomadura litoris]MUN38537.1 hypothetical protein [Actinomadura litoris]